MSTAAEIEAKILQLVRERGPEKSVCPSEVARALCPDEAAWRALMTDVRAVAADLAESGRLRILQGGADVPDPRNPRGPVRLAVFPDAPRLTP